MQAGQFSPVSGRAKGLRFASIPLVVGVGFCAAANASPFLYEWHAWFGGDGTIDPKNSFGYSDGNVLCAKVFDGELYIGGNFTRMANHGKPAPGPDSPRVRGVLSFHSHNGFGYLGSPSTNGVDADGIFAQNANVTVWTMEVFDRGYGDRLIVAGEFGWVDDFAVEGIAEWDGTDWYAFPPPPPLTRGSNPRYISQLLSVEESGTQETLLYAAIYMESEPNVGPITEMWYFRPSTGVWIRAAAPVLGEHIEDMIAYGDGVFILGYRSEFLLLEGNDKAGYELADPPVYLGRTPQIVSGSWVFSPPFYIDFCHSLSDAGPPAPRWFAEYSGSLYVSTPRREDLEECPIPDPPPDPVPTPRGSLPTLSKLVSGAWYGVDAGWIQENDRGTGAILSSGLLGQEYLFVGNGNEAYIGLEPNMVFSITDGFAWGHPGMGPQLRRVQAGNVPSVMVEYDGYIYAFGGVEGSFDGAGGGFDVSGDPQFFRKQNMARFGPPCRADLTGSSTPADLQYGVPDGVVDAEDFFMFLALYGDGDMLADITGSATPSDPMYGVPDGVLDSDDFFYFLEIYALGCD